MFGISKAHMTVAAVSLAAFAVLVFVQRGMNFKIPVIGPYLPGGQ